MESRKKHPLMFRLFVLNFVGVAAFLAAVHQGWVWEMLQHDHTYISHVLVGMLFLTIGRVFYSGVQFVKDQRSRYSTLLAQFEGNRAASTESAAEGALHNRFLNRLDFVTVMMYLQTMIGLFGTALGIYNAFSPVSQMMAENPDDKTAILSPLISGVGTSLVPTVVGLAGTIWLYLNHRILARTSSSIVEDIELGRE